MMARERRSGNALAAARGATFAALWAFLALAAGASAEETPQEPAAPAKQSGQPAAPTKEPSPAATQPKAPAETGKQPATPPVPSAARPTQAHKAQRSPEELRRAAERLAESRKEMFRAHYFEALRAFRSGRYAGAIASCDRALAIEPESLAAQRLRYAAERARQGHRLAMEFEKDLFLDEEALAEVDRESRFPEEKQPLPRPRLALREEMPRSEAMRRMEEKLNQRVSMNFIDADLDYVIQTLFKISGVDIIAEQSVVADKKLTLHVENVPLKEILEFIERNYEGITYSVTENAVWLTTPEKPPLVPRSYPLSRGLVSESAFQTTGVRSRTAGSVDTSRLPRQLSGLDPSSLSRALGQLTGAAGTQAAGAAGAAGGTGAGGGSYLESVLRWVETWKDEWPQGSSWQIDRQTNTLFVMTTPQMHDRIEEILDVLDTPPIQILVRTKFTEVLADDLREFGLSSASFLEWTNRKLIDGTTPEGTDVSVTGMGGASSGLQFRMGKYLTNTSQIIATLNALEKKQRTKVLSAPQVIAMNNTPATIDVSKSFSYASQYQPATGTSYLSGGQTVQNVSALIPSQFEEVNVGFFMEFVPSVGRDMKNIVLDLHARVDDVVGNIEDFKSVPIIFPGQDENGTGGTGTFTTQAVQRPVIDSREFRTRLVVEDGETVILGGLLKNYRESVDRRVPILGDIPLVGLLFRYRKDMVRQSNLLIAVQAQIIAPSGRRYATGGPAGEPGGDSGFGLRSFGAPPERKEWVPELAPELERELFAPGR